MSAVILTTWASDLGLAGYGYCYQLRQYSHPVTRANDQSLYGGIGWSLDTLYESCQIYSTVTELFFALYEGYTPIRGNQTPTCLPDFNAPD